MSNSKNDITLVSILKDSNYNLALFNDKDVKALESKIKVKKNKPYVCYY